MPDRLIELTDHQIAILRQLQAGEMKLIEFSPEDAGHLTIFKSRGLAEIYKGDDDRVSVRLTEDGVRLADLAAARQEPVPKEKRSEIEQPAPSDG